jgi:hypothetical protein
MKKIDLIITLENLKEIISGEKKEDYRQFSRYNQKALCELIKEDQLYYPRKDLTHVRFLAGYRKDRKYALCEISGIYFDLFKKFIPRGMKPGSEAITIEIRQVVEHNL